MTKDYFGKGCKYLIGQWEDQYLYEEERYKENTPELIFCNHPDNECDTEGNCNGRDCPLIGLEWAKQFKTPNSFRASSGKER
jgi:hypothetical protein